MTNQLATKDIIALGFMTFALFVGAGNIIFPPLVGLQSGDNVWTAAIGFMLTAVILPVIAVISLARVGGNIVVLTRPLGRYAGFLMAVICYLSLGPLFATPRTASVSFAVGIAPIIGNDTTHQFIYSLLFFTFVIVISLHPNKLLNSVGHILAPLKIVALFVLGISALLWSAKSPTSSISAFQEAPLSTGFIHGYQTMDTLSALMFGAIIVMAARSRGVSNSGLLLRYTLLASLLAGIGLSLLYLCLFKLGANSRDLVSVTNTHNGADILYAYVNYTFGNIGTVFMAIMMFIACLIAAVGMTCACADFFSQYLPISYKILVIIFSTFAMFVSNMGLNDLIRVSLPVLTIIYPPCIVLVLLSFSQNYWKSAKYVFIPVVSTSLLFSIFDSIKSTSVNNILPYWFYKLPMAGNGMVWIVPTLIVLLFACIYDRYSYHKQ